MCRERVVFRTAGSLVLLGLALGYELSPWWLLLSAFVGLNLLQSSFSGFCPLTKLLIARGVPPCAQGSPLG
jgi:hypothetical protein